MPLGFWGALWPPWWVWRGSVEDVVTIDCFLDLHHGQGMGPSSRGRPNIDQFQKGDSDNQANNQKIVRSLTNQSHHGSRSGLFGWRCCYILNVRLEKG